MVPASKWMANLIRQRLAKGRQVFFEQPWPSHMWYTLVLQRLLQDAPEDALTGEPLEAVKCDQCEFGLCDWDTGTPHKKSTGVMTASRGIKANMNVQCSRTHDHVQLAGGQRTRRAQQWPRPFCQAILDGLCGDLDLITTKVAFPAEVLAEENPLGALDRIYDAKDEVPEHLPVGRCDELEIKQEEGREQEGPGQTQQDQLRKREWLRLPLSQRVAVRRLHQMTGHASVSAMARMLRLGRADPEVLHRLKHFRCEACQARQRPEPRPVVKPPSQYSFNHELAADTFEVRDGLGNKFTVLSVICMGTLYHAAWIVSETGGVPSSLRCAEALRDGWFGIFGPPKFLTVDRGVANRGQVAYLMSSQGVYLRYAGTAAAHHIGRAERHGGLLKEVISHAVAARNIVGAHVMKMLVGESCFVKNNRVNHAGFSPSQWVLGRMPIEVTSMTSEEGQEALGVQQEVLDGTSAFAQQMSIRQAAKQAFEYADSSRRVRTALLRRSTPLRGPYHPGDLLCFNRRGKWFGPARMVGWEGRSNLWLIHGGIPIVISQECVRPATSGEVIAKQMLELRPSRKRKRHLLDEDAEDVPFSDDLLTNLEQDEDDDHQGSYLDMGRGGDLSSVASPSVVDTPNLEPEAPPSNFDAPPGLDGVNTLPPVPEHDMMMSDVDGVNTLPPPVEPGQEGVNTLPPPAMADQDGVNTLPPPAMDDSDQVFDDFDELLDGLRMSRMDTVEEPDLEHQPSDGQPAQPSNLHQQPPAADPVNTQLSQALRRSPDLLDGHYRASRGRSRSPHRDAPIPPTSATEDDVSLSRITFFAKQNDKQKQQSETLLGFMARRTPKRYVKKKAGSREFNYKKEPEDLQKRIDVAREKEWGNWMNFDACEVIEPELAAAFKSKHPGVQVVPTRWVDINKAQEGEPEQLKSRLVVRGDLERSAQHGEVRTDSPTASHLMLSLILTFASCFELVLHAGDITAAFLQGLGLARVLVMALPADGIPGVKPGSLLVARKPVYGTKDAPRGFWRSLHKTMLKFAFRSIPHENAAYVMLKDDGSIDGLVISHVDDLIWCGGEKTQKAMQQVQQELKFGKLEDTCFKFCGRSITQDEKGIHVTCPHGLERTRPIAVSTGRKKNRSSLATPDEQSQLRSVLGSLNWVVRVCRPDLAYDTNQLQTKVQKPTVQDLLDCNTLLRRAVLTKDQKLTYGWKMFDFNKAQILSITDASHANDHDVSQSGEVLGCRSQSGRILALCGPDFMQNNGGRIALIKWRSSVIRRVCRSTLQAESLSMLAGYEESEHLRCVLDGLLHDHPPSSPDWQVRAKDNINVLKLTDCRSLSDHLLQRGLGEVNDKRLAIDLSGMRQMIWRKHGQCVGDPLYDDAPPESGTTQAIWISTKTMLSDSLTKHMDTHDLREVMEGATYKIEVHAKKKDGCENQSAFQSCPDNALHVGMEPHVA